MKYITGNYLDLGKKESEIRYNLKSIIKYIYCQIPLDHDKMKKLYKYVEVDCDYDYKKDDDYDYLGPDFMPNKMQDDEYVYKFKHELNESYFPEPHSGEDINNELIREMHEFLIEKSPKKLILKDIRTIKLIKNKGVNKDRRGVRDLDWKLHFWQEYIISSKRSLKLHDLIIAAYKIKSHKFEKWYEMFCRVSYDDFIIFHNSDDKKKWKEITAVLEFDHGS
ncbi:hypothetical protein H012_gp012 [Acanthamoeba polyphaga moumouvirus]|uniref:Uncharacterized protein n=1 Tax=Acanthamoeba polyphaga moumouvirus TaxID=1269028 RepID=L7RDS5_9VIRU|nr:hypothetical protein H012_gp012 [Acanthamoeba polyphaga moumouvirus]AGC02436.1 hypothetical protein Moumou_00921 [Acanthamoeba polyphaga moumouvirus]